MESLSSFKSLIMVTPIGLILMLGISSCQHTFTIASEPAGATVSPLNTTGVADSPIGQTPVAIEVVSDQTHMLYEIKKMGYETVTVVVPYIDGAQAADLNIKLKEMDTAWFRERLLQDQSMILSSQFMQLLKLQNAILQGDHEDVANLTQSMKADFDMVSAWHALLGNHYFIKNDRDNALLHFTRAYELDPTNIEARAMVETLTGRGGN